VGCWTRWKRCNRKAAWGAQPAVWFDGSCGEPRVEVDARGDGCAVAVGGLAGDRIGDVLAVGTRRTVLGTPVVVRRGDDPVVLVQDAVVLSVPVVDGEVVRTNVDDRPAAPPGQTEFRFGDPDAVNRVDVVVADRRGTGRILDEDPVDATEVVRDDGVPTAGEFERAAAFCSIPSPPPKVLFTNLWLRPADAAHLEIRVASLSATVLPDPETLIPCSAVSMSLPVTVLFWPPIAIATAGRRLRTCCSRWRFRTRSIQ